MGKPAYGGGERRLSGCLLLRDARLFLRYGGAHQNQGSCMKDEITMIPIDRIRIVNPRHRDPKKFQLIVKSIKTLGLKKPIQVSLRPEEDADGPGYELVCGQGRIEA